METGPIRWRFSQRKAAMGGRNGRRGDEPLAVVAVAGAAVVRGLVRPTPVEAEDWCPAWCWPGWVSGGRPRGRRAPSDYADLFLGVRDQRVTIRPAIGGALTVDRLVLKVKTASPNQLRHGVRHVAASAAVDGSPGRRRRCVGIISAGELPAYKLGRVLRLQRGDVLAYMQRCRIKPGSLRHLYPPGEHGEPPKKR
jgi:hypothetical protein